MVKFILLFICLLIGALLRRTSLFNDESPKVINNLLIYFFIPVMTLYYVPKIDFEYRQIWLSLTPFIVYFSSFGFFRFLGPIQMLDKKTEGALIMCSGIGSISFVGFPVFELLYGEEGLSYGIVLSLTGTFVVFNTVGIYTGVRYSEDSAVSIWDSLKKMVTFPPFLAFLMASILNLLGVEYSDLIDGILKNLCAPFSVLALLTIGMQMDFSMDSELFRPLLMGQVFKLLLAPLIIYLLMWQVFGVTDLVARICILGAAIGSMNAISIVAAQMGINPKLAVAMPAIGIPISIPLLFLIDNLLK